MIEASVQSVVASRETRIICCMIPLPTYIINSCIPLQTSKDYGMPHFHSVDVPVMILCRFYCNSIIEYHSPLCMDSVK